MRQGWDSPTADMQHGVQDYASGIDGLVAGIHCAESADASQMVEKAFDMVTVPSDTRLFMADASAAVSESRAGRPAE